jgi:predicted acylesterase/phospholipase RssA
MMEMTLNPPDQGGLRMCDLVMKGGITSGIVYPPAVIELKDHYRFRHIGGTSAGAIAAAVTAAAEFNREEGGFKKLGELSDWLGQGNNLRNLFQPIPETSALMDIIDVLIAPPPSPATPASNGAQNPGASQQSILRNIIPFLNKLAPAWRDSNPDYSLGARKGMWYGIGAGIVLAFIVSLIVFSILSFLVPPGLRNVVVLIVLIVSGVASGVLGGLRGRRVGGLLGGLTGLVDKVTKTLPNNFYGICPGHQDGASNVLTDWLYNGIESVAGPDHDSPLTFGQLKKKKINLDMVTSNLSHQQPYVMPAGLQNFVFKEVDMFKLFPAEVVKHMIDNPPENSIIPRDRLPEGYYFLPGEVDLPIIVCTRMSLSFPVLLSAIPLYTIKSSALGQSGVVGLKLTENDLQINWFSDGGISSNFPIQFFDAWLPKIPTFGINLTSMPEESFTTGQQPSALTTAVAAQTAAATTAGAQQPAAISSTLTGKEAPASSTQAQQPAATIPAGAAAQNGHRANQKLLSRDTFSALDMKHVRRSTTPVFEDVYLPKPEDLQDPEWQELDSVPGFLYAAFRTAQNYRDNLQASLPSYRERVVQIRLNKDEGGLNLNMPPEIITRVAEKGQRAGKILSDPHDFNFEHHWWVRFRVLMAQLELNLEGIQGVLDSPGFDGRLEQQFSSETDVKLKFPYYRDETWCKEAIKRVGELRTLIDAWQDAHSQSPMPHLFSTDPPLPQPVLRVTPEV